jgi:hypothetical protein
VKAKADVQPYSIGGTLTVKTNIKGDDLWMMEINHKLEYIADGQTSPGGDQPSIWEVKPNLSPTGSGQGANMFGDQLMACLLLPMTDKERYPLFGDNVLFASATMKVEEMIKVTSKVSSPTGEHTIERYLNAKTLKLMKAKCESKSALGKIVYELLPSK